MRPSRTFLSPSLQNKKKTLLKNFGKWHFLTPRLKLSYIFSNKNFSSISGSRTFSKNFLYFRRELSELKKQKQTHSWKLSYNFSKKNFLIFWEMVLSGSQIKNGLMFSQKEVFLIFWERQLFKKFLIFQAGTFKAQKIKKSTLKKFLIFCQMELSSPKLKKILYFF